MLQPVKKQSLAELATLYQIFSDQPMNLPAMETLWDKVQGDPNYQLLGYYQEERLLASITVLLGADFIGDCQPFMVLENVVVSEECRGQGIGKQMMQEVEDLAKEKGCGLMMLVSSGFRKDAHRFYEQCGYDEEVRGFRKRL